MAVTAVILSPMISACLMYLLCVHSPKKKKKKNDYQMVSGTQLCILDIKDTALKRRKKNLNRLSLSPSPPLPPHPQNLLSPISSMHTLTLIQIWIFRYKRLAVIKCFSERKLGNWVFLWVSTRDKITRGMKKGHGEEQRKSHSCS